jgi:hypothetical protein
MLRLSSTNYYHQASNKESIYLSIYSLLINYNLQRKNDLSLYDNKYESCDYQM